MKLNSSAFTNNAVIPSRYTCDGENLSPPLAWSGVPKGTKSFAAICEDPDAPRGTFMHWGIYDIPADWNALAEGTSPVPADLDLNEAINDFHTLGYGGPCPPHERGAHRYHFYVWALPVERLSVPANPRCSDVKREARKQALAEAVLVGVYER